MLCLAAIALAAPVNAADGPLSEYSRGGVSSGRSVREPNRTMHETSAGSMKSRPVHEYGGPTMRSGSVTEATAGLGRDAGQLSGSGSIGEASAGAVTARQPPPGPVSDQDLEALQESMRALLPVPDGNVEPETEIAPEDEEAADAETAVPEGDEPPDQILTDDAAEPEPIADEPPREVEEQLSGDTGEPEATPAQEP